jgi:hypothetical protein
LILRAAAVQGLDVSKARFFDRHWWIKVRLLTDHFERDLLAQAYLMHHASQCALLASGQEKAGDIWEAMEALANRMIRMTMPWLNLETKADKRRQIVENWKKIYGDPSDPKMAAKIRATAMALIRDANIAITKAERGW